MDDEFTTWLVVHRCHGEDLTITEYEVEDGYLDEDDPIFAGNGKMERWVRVGYADLVNLNYATRVHAILKPKVEDWQPE